MICSNLICEDIFELGNLVMRGKQIKDSCCKKIWLNFHSSWFSLIYGWSRKASDLLWGICLISNVVPKWIFPSCFNWQVQRPECSNDAFCMNNKHWQLDWLKLTVTASSLRFSPLLTVRWWGWGGGWGPRQEQTGPQGGPGEGQERVRGSPTLESTVSVLLTPGSRRDSSAHPAADILVLTW